MEANSFEVTVPKQYVYMQLLQRFGSRWISFSFDKPSGDGSRSTWSNMWKNLRIRLCFSPESNDRSCLRGTAKQVGQEDTNENY
jgi:hypothetical protein